MSRATEDREYVGTFCGACGVSFQRQALLGVLIALGAKTRDPNDCWASDDGEHEWERRYRGEGDDDVAE